MGGDNPESVVLALESVDDGALVQVPYTDGLILASRKDQVLVWVEQAAACVLEVASASINLPLNTQSAMSHDECAKIDIFGNNKHVSRGFIPRTALVSLIRHNLMRRSSPADTIKGMVGWNATQFTPLS